MNLWYDWQAWASYAGVKEWATLCVEVGVVYFLVYRLLYAIRGTRAAQVAMGILAVVVIYYVSLALNLVTLNWLLGHVFEIGIILVVILFQEDIRRGLARLGQRISQMGRPVELSLAVDEVVDAAEQLARTKHGALVVFEREVGLDEFIDHGEELDARVSAALLCSLFVPARDNSLHDGAVIIRGFRIYRAGALLPLSRSPLAAHVGTRHRAGLGITEETDAVAVVVSEERSEISLCMRGNLAPNLGPNDLRSALRELFSGGRQSESVAEEAQMAAEVSRAVAAMAGESLESFPAFEPVESEGNRPLRESADG